MRSLMRTATTAVLIILAATGVAWAQGNGTASKKPEITAALVSVDETVLFVQGANLGTHPTITLGDVPLTGVAVDASGKQLSASLPVLTAGTYLLTLTTGSWTTQFAVAIDAYQPASSSGTAGPTGPAGPAGPAGEVGPAGPIGPAGPVGPAGAIGPAGPAGATGADGATGPIGPMGATGPTGSAGPIGPAGPAGATGPAGPAGATGAMGPAGPAGAIGPTGPEGPTGAIGAAGPTGAAGAMGPAGPAGATGPAGPAGPTGALGPAGPAGASGPAGPAGPVGSPGPIGAPGAAGPMGPAGPAGPMPFYIAAWVRGTAAIRFGAGFSVVRFGLTGSYRITIPPTPTGRFLVTVVTPVAANAIARVVQFSRNALDGTSTIDVEIHDVTTGNFVDSDFNFIAHDQS